jgi:lysophospholipase L1-like esterase
MAFVFSFGAADGLHSVPRAESLANTRAILGEAAGLGTTLFLSPPPAHEADWTSAILELGAAQREICSELGVPCFDFHAPLKVSAAYMASLAAGDGIHPDSAGYEEMAALLEGWQPMRELLSL